MFKARISVHVLATANRYTLPFGLADHMKGTHHLKRNSYPIAMFKDDQYLGFILSEWLDPEECFYHCVEVAKNRSFLQPYLRNEPTCRWFDLPPGTPVDWHTTDGECFMVDIVSINGDEHTAKIASAGREYTVPLKRLKWKGRPLAKHLVHYPERYEWE